MMASSEDGAEEVPVYWTNLVNAPVGQVYQANAQGVLRKEQERAVVVHRTETTVVVHFESSIHFDCTETICDSWRQSYPIA